MAALNKNKKKIYRIFGNPTWTLIGCFHPLNYRVFPVDYNLSVCYYWSMIKLMKALIVVLIVISFLIIGYSLYLYIFAKEISNIYPAQK